jgi:hypothetical protein
MVAAAVKKNEAQVGDDRAVLELIQNSAFVKREIAAQADAQTAARQALFTELASLDVDGAAERGSYEAAIGAAIAIVEGKMRAAIQVAVAVQSTHDQSRFSRDGRRSEIEASLRAAANPVIDAFRTWLLDEDARICREPVEFLQIGEVKNPITGRRSSSRVITNNASIVARLAAVREALRQLDDLRMLPDQREIPARIVEIKESFPVIEPPKAPMKEVAE